MSNSAFFFVFLGTKSELVGKKLQPYFFLRLQQFSAEPPPHPPLGTQVPPFEGIDVQLPRMPNFRPCGAEIPIFWLSCGANWLLTHELVKNVNLNYYVSVCSRVENAVMRKTWITTITNRTCGYVETRGSWEIVVFYEYHIVLVVMGKTRKYARTMTFYEYQIVNVAVGKREQIMQK